MYLEHTAVILRSHRTDFCSYNACRTKWLEKYRCGEGCYGGVYERWDVLTASCPKHADRQLQGDEGKEGTECCYYVPPGDYCDMKHALWTMEISPPGMPDQKPRTVTAEVLLADRKTSDLTLTPWPYKEKGVDKSIAPLVEPDTVKDIINEGDHGWVEVDLGGANSMPLVASGRPGLDTPEYRWLELYQRACPFDNPNAPMP